MKTLLLPLLFVMACGFSEPRVPAVCQRNLHDCLVAYEEDKIPFCIEQQNCSHADWDMLCRKDLNTCESNNHIDRGRMR